MVVLANLVQTEVTMKSVNYKGLSRALVKFYLIM